MTPEERELHTYLGDGVYAEITTNHIILRTGSHKDNECENKIYIEDTVLMGFLRWLEVMSIRATRSFLNYLPLENFFNDLNNKKDAFEKAKNNNQS